MPNRRMEGKLNEQAVTEGVREYQYSKGDRKSYLVNSKLLIDAGCPLTEEQLEPVQLEYLALTHCHCDHIVYAKKIKEVTGCKLVSSEQCAQHLREMDEVVLKEQFKRMLGAEHALIEPLDIDRVVGEGDKLGPLQVIATPGHSDGSLSFYHQSQKLLFSGDTYFGAGRGRTDLPGADPSALETSLQKLQRLDYELLCPGHGDTKRC